MRFLVDQVLRRTSVHVRVRLELEQQVQNVDKEEYLCMLEGRLLGFEVLTHNTCTPTDFQNHAISGSIIAERGVERCRQK